MAAYDGSNFIVGIGPLFLYMVAYVLFLLLRWMIISQFDDVESCQKRVRPWFQSHNVETATVRLVLEGNIDILLCALISVVYMNNTDSFGEKFQDKLSNGFGILMMLALAYAPVHALMRAIQFKRIQKEDLNSAD